MYVRYNFALFWQMKALNRNYKKWLYRSKYYLTYFHINEQKPVAGLQ